VAFILLHFLFPARLKEGNTHTNKTKGISQGLSGFSPPRSSGPTRLWGGSTVHDVGEGHAPLLHRGVIARQIFQIRVADPAEKSFAYFGPVLRIWL
jgi:hypothetical protein